MTEQQSWPCDPHVLVVEDELLVRMSTVATLEDLDCTTLEAGTADEALCVIQKNPEIRVVFTDIQMPGTLDGLELAKLVRHRWPSITVIISSGRILPPKSSLTMPVRFIAKPYYHYDLEAIALASGC
jgi:two-component system, response regulator PdtaR